MKNYKKLMPIVLAVLLVLSCYKLISDSKVKENQYLAYLEDARLKKEQGIYADSFALFKKALDMHSSMELIREMGEVVLAQGDKRENIIWGEYVVERYPTSSDGYEFLIQVYEQEENYQSCFQVYEQAKQRQSVSKQMQELIGTIEYEYKLSYDKYDDVSVFADGFCAVKEEEKWGYVNNEGELVIPLQYEEAGTFGSLRAPVKEEQELYYIDKTGKKSMIIPKEIKAEKIGFFENNIYAVGNAKGYQYCDEEGTVLFGPYQEATTFNYDRAAVKQEDRWHFIKRDGQKLNETTYQAVITDEKGISFRNERAFAVGEDEYQMLDTEGNVVSEETFTDAKVFLDNTYAAVRKGIRWGFVDKEGNMVIEPQFEEAHSFSHGFAAVKKGNTWGFINLDGEMVIAPAFQDVTDFNEKERCFVKQNDEWVMLKLLRSNY